MVGLDVAPGVRVRKTCSVEKHPYLQYSAQYSVKTEHTVAIGIVPVCCLSDKLISCASKRWMAQGARKRAHIPTPGVDSVFASDTLTENKTEEDPGEEEEVGDGVDAKKEN